MILCATNYSDGPPLDVLETWDSPLGNGVRWLSLVEPTPSEMHGLDLIFGLHERAIDDAMEADQHPKMEVFGDMVLVAARSITNNEGQVDTGEVQIFVNERCVAVVQHGAIRIQQPSEANSTDGMTDAMMLLHHVCTQIVEGYRTLGERLDADLEAIEAAVFRQGGADAAEDLYNLKRDVLAINSAARPFIRPLELLAAGSAPLSYDSVYFRDVLDDLRLIVTRTDAVRELSTAVLQASQTQISIHLAEVGIRQNEDMRRISAWVAIAAAPTIITGIYGMNFTDLPELDWRLGYPFAISLMALSSALLYWLFHKSSWL